MKLQYVIALVVVGVVYGLVQPGKLTYAFGHATLYILLPALLFEAAWNLQFRAMRRQWRSIATLVIPGVALTALVIAGALAVVRVPFGVALLTGAILSATDPIAVVAIFRRVRVPLTLRTIVECEALFNDAVAVVLYRAVLAVLLVGGSIGSIGSVALTSLAGSALGIVIGVGVAFIVGAVLRNRTNEGLQIVATFACAYGTYFAAEAFGGSGIFATIASGIALRYFERAWISLRVAEDVNRFWDLVALVANAIVFFLVGSALDVSVISHAPIFVIATLIGVMISRFAIAGLLLPAGFPRSWLDVIRVASMRGALSLALALALPETLPYREAIVAATFAVALATIISSGFTVPGVVARAGRTPLRG